MDVKLISATCHHPCFTPPNGYIVVLQSMITSVLYNTLQCCPVQFVIHWFLQENICGLTGTN